MKQTNVCPKCNKEMIGAKYYIAALKQWICKVCYFDIKDE